jgi:putative transposase
LHQHRIRQIRYSIKVSKLFEKADQIRRQHPRVGCRKMALDLRCQGMGRDKTEALLLSHGYRVFYCANYTRTTQAQQRFLYPNLIEGMELNGINQVIQTDMTYVRVVDKFFYVIFIIDVYSRRIIGYSVNRSMHAEGNIKALKMALQTRTGCKLGGMIHHSDRGRQYIDEQYVKLLGENGIDKSMCKEAWQNAYTERINRTIKEEYLQAWDITKYDQLKVYVARAVKHYNTQRRHQSLGWESPVDFESKVEKLSKDQRPKMKIYKPLDQISTNIV